MIVSGPMLFPGVGVLAVFGLAWSLISFERPRLSVLFLMVVSMESSGVFGLFIPMVVFPIRCPSRLSLPAGVWMVI